MQTDIHERNKCRFFFVAGRLADPVEKLVLVSVFHANYLEL